MKIINLTPNPSGGHPSPQDWSAAAPPDGFAVIPNDFDLTTFFEMRGFVNITAANGVVTTMTANQTAYDASFPPPTTDELRAAALQRIVGKCSAAIYSGVSVGDKHYKLSPTAQGNLKTALDKVASGAASVIYAADNEEPALHTAAQITAINNAAYEWGIVNTTYYSKLQKWIARETDTAILNAIDYGKQLPADLMQELTDLLTSAGIDVTKYTGLFTGGNT